MDKRLVFSVRVFRHQLATSLNLSCFCGADMTIYEEICETNKKGFIADEGKLQRLAESL